MLLIIDNYDSFTWNLVQRIGELDASRRMEVVRNDMITVDEAEAVSPSLLLLSPGPCTPEESGICRPLINHFRGRIPILGVCLGHQAIADTAGMDVVRYESPMHGKTSMIHHDGSGVFRGLTNPFEATRYHSLIVDRASIGDEFTVSAWTDDGVCMGLRGKGEGSPLEGGQFHPESFLTSEGPDLIANFLSYEECPA